MPASTARACTAWGLIFMVSLVAVCGGVRVRGISGDPSEEHHKEHHEEAHGLTSGELDTMTLKQVLSYVHEHGHSSGPPLTDTEQVQEVDSPRAGVPLPGVDSFGFGYDVLSGTTKGFPIFDLQYPADVYDEDTWSALDGKINFAKAVERMEHTTEDYRAEDEETYLIPLQFSARPTNWCSFASSSDYFSTVDSYAQELSISAGVSIPGAFTLSSTVSSARELTDNSRKRLMVSKAKCTSYHVALDDLEGALPSRTLQQFFGFAGLLKCSDGTRPPCDGAGEDRLDSVSDPVEPHGSSGKEEPDGSSGKDEPDGSRDKPDAAKDEGDDLVPAAAVKDHAAFSIKKGGEATGSDLELLQESTSRYNFDGSCLQQAHSRYISGGTQGSCLNGLKISEGKDIVNPDDAMRCKRFLGIGSTSKYQEFCKKVEVAMSKWIQTPDHIMRAMNIDGEEWPDEVKAKALANKFCESKVSAQFSTCSYGPRDICKGMVVGMFRSYRECHSSKAIEERSLDEVLKVTESTCKDCSKVIMECVEHSLLEEGGCTRAYDRAQSTSWIFGSMSWKDYSAICDKTREGFRACGITETNPEHVNNALNVLSKESPLNSDKASIEKFCSQRKRHFPVARTKKPDSQDLCVKMLQSYAMCARNGLSGLGYDMFPQNNQILGRQIGSVDGVNAELRALSQDFEDRQASDTDHNLREISTELTNMEDESFKDNLFNNRRRSPDKVFNRLFESFGTHYVESADIGGMVNEMQSVKRTLHARNSQMSLSTNFEVSAGPIPVSVGGSASASSSESHSSTQGVEKTVIKMHGGRPTGMASDANIKDVWADWAPSTMSAGVPIDPKLRSICDLILILDKGENIGPIPIEKKRKLMTLCNLRMASYVRSSARVEGSYTVIMETAMGSQGDKILQYRMSTLFLTMSSQVTSTGTDSEIVNYPLPNLREDLDMLNFAPGQITEFEIHGPHLDTLKSISLRPGRDTIMDSELQSPDMWTYLFSRAVILDRVTGRPYFFKYPMLVDPRNLAPAQVRDFRYPSRADEVMIGGKKSELTMADDPAMTVFIYLKNDDRAPSVSKRIFIRLQGSAASVTLKAYIDKRVPYYSNGIWREGSCAENYWIGTKLKNAPPYSTPDMHGISDFWSAKYKKDMIEDPEALKMYCSNLLVPGGITRLEIRQDQLPLNPPWIGKLHSVEIQNYHKDAVGIDKIRVFDGSAQRYMGKGTDKAIYAYTADFDDRFIGFPAEPKSESGLPRLKIFGGRKKVSDKDMPVTNATPVVRKLLTPMFLDDYDQ